MMVDFAHINQRTPLRMLAVARKIVQGEATRADADELYQLAVTLSSLIDPDVGKFVPCPDVDAAFAAAREAMLLDDLSLAGPEWMPMEDGNV